MAIPGLPADMMTRHMTRLLLFAASVFFTLPRPPPPPRISGVKSVPRSVLKLERDYIAPIATPDAAIKAGAVVDVLLLSGKTYERLEISAIQTAKDPGDFRGLTFKAAKEQPSKLQPNSIAQLKTAERTFDVVAEPKSKAWLLLDQTKRDEVASPRLEARGHVLWPAPAMKNTTKPSMKPKNCSQKPRRCSPAPSSIARKLSTFCSAPTSLRPR